MLRYRFFVYFGQARSLSLVFKLIKMIWTPPALNKPGNGSLNYPIQWSDHIIWSFCETIAGHARNIGFYDHNFRGFSTIHITFSLHLTVLLLSPSFLRELSPRDAIRRLFLFGSNICSIDHSFDRIYESDQRIESITDGSIIHSTAP